MARVTVRNVWAFLQGTLRYRLYYSRFQWLIRRHVRAQIEWRIRVMEAECLGRGSCVRCGCRTTALQMASKSCDKPCYPPMMGRRRWRRFLAGEPVWVAGAYWTQEERGGVVVVYRDGCRVHARRIED